MKNIDFTKVASFLCSGNPAKTIRKRFDDELIQMMQNLKWWDKSVEEIDNLIPILTNGNLSQVKEEIIKLLENNDI